MADFKLRDYQVEGVDWIQERLSDASVRGCILADGRGLGKTAQLIEASRQIFHGETEATTGDLWRDHAPLIVVIAPGTARADWKREFKSWWPECTVHVAWSGSSFDRVTLRDFDWSKATWQKPNVLIISASDKLLKGAREFLETRVEKLPGLVLVDEAHYFKNMKSLRATEVRYFVARAWRNIFTTGTPVWDKPQDLFNLLSLLDPSGHRNIWTWARRYFFFEKVVKNGVEYGTRIGKLVHEDRLKEDCKPFIWGRSAKDVMADLPPRRFRTVKVTSSSTPRISPAKLRARASVREEFDEILRKCASLKTDAVADFAVDQNEPVIVYVYERAHAKEMVAALTKRGMSAVSATGELAPHKRDLVLQEWKNGSHLALVCTLDAVRESTTLTRSALMLFADYTYSWSAMLQCMGRIDPARQSPEERRPAEYVLFAIDGGPDEVVAETLLEKIEQGNFLLGDVVAEQLADTLSSAVGRQRLPKSESTDSMMETLIQRIEASERLRKELE